MAALQYKDDHNRIAYLWRERGFEDFTDILSYLDYSPLRYALTHNPPVVFDSLVKQFWATATVRPNAAGSHDLVLGHDQATVPSEDIEAREEEEVPLRRKRSVHRRAKELDELLLRMTDTDWLTLMMQV
ncbi:hypothetical protein Tco_0338978, partial [Tanacetum coccineum]